MGDGPVHRGHTGECCGGAPAGNRDAWSSCHSAPQRRVAPCLCVQKGAITRSCRNVPMHGIASARRARPWILYGPSEQSRWAPQLGQRSWQACMSIIWHPHMGHSFFLPAGIHHTPGSAPYYSCRQARCLRQRLPCLCAYLRQSCRMRGSPVKCDQGRKTASACPMHKGTRWIRRHCLIKAPCRIPALPGPLQRHALGPTCMGILRIQPY